ncbi:hypothetical protein GALMADRAFT_146102 [Galerina marginata CBS 339.88]|uniref:F-box domain-containing protein n=1 Tax=Galerina marginata (strain CBS 339.88) TaxID=685588 RepID=A0A067SCV4_GALM3|nr:hypothetical protein GALMADRAFT_146102 [Galerina marginata CBS 339.88]
MQQLAKAPAINTQGLPALPDDLHLEIISHFSFQPVPTKQKHWPETFDVRSLRDRHLALRSLSQTCRSLRPFYLRYLWQRIEVFDEMETDKGALEFVHQCDMRRSGNTKMDMLYVEELSRQLEIVTIRDSSLALHVNILNLTIVADFAETVLPELGRCIALLPNLHTVQFDFRLDINEFPESRNALVSNRYPQIQTACLSASAYFFIACCPNLRHVMAHNYFPIRVGLLEIVVQHCPQVEVLAPLFTPDPMNRMISQLQNLRDVSLDCAYLMDRKTDLEALSQLPHLHTIRIRVDIDGYMSFRPRRELHMTSEDVEDCVEWGRRILSGHETGEVHRVIVVYKDRETEINSEP